MKRRVAKRIIRDMKRGGLSGPWLRKRTRNAALRKSGYEYVSFSTTVAIPRNY